MALEPLLIMFSWWKGARVGLFAYNTDRSATNTGVADFDWFHYRPSPATRWSSWRMAATFILHQLFPLLQATDGC